MTDFIQIHEAYVAGDGARIRELLANPGDWPHTATPDIPVPLQYAIYHSPLDFVKELLHAGADPNYESDDGFPALAAAISSGRLDLLELVRILLDAGADVHHRDFNDYTPLHSAVAMRHPELISVLLDHGADPRARTRIDDRATPLEEAQYQGNEEGAAMLLAALKARGRNSN